MNDAMPTMDALIGIDDCEAFDYEGVRYYLRRYGLTDAHRDAWKAARRASREIEIQCENDVAILKDLDAEFEAGAMSRSEYMRAQRGPEEAIYNRATAIEPALDVLLDVHLVAVKCPSTDTRALLALSNPATRRAIAFDSKLGITRMVRERLIEDFGPDQTERDFGLENEPW
jgi:hypothetical protein